MSIETTTSPRPRVDPQKVLTNACGDMQITFDEERLKEELDDVAYEIDGLVRESKRIAFKLGHMYRIAYQLCPAGTFKKWVEELGFHHSTQAYAYMKVYKVCLGREELAQNIPNTILTKMCEGKFPEDLREQILNCGLAEHKSGRPAVKVREIVEAGAKVALGEWSLTGPEVRRLLYESDEQQTGAAASIIFREFQKCLSKTIDRLKELQRDAPTSSEIQETINKRIEQLGLLSGSMW